MTADSKRIMVGYNASFTSDKVLDVAREHARAFGGTLLVVSSVVGHELDENGALEDPRAQERLSKVRESLDAEGIPHEVHVIARGENPGADLVNFARQHNIGEIVVGFKQRSALGEMVFGSNYRYMIAKAPCPIVTVHDWE